MDGAQEIPIRRYQAGRMESVSDPVVREAKVELDVNDGRLRIAMLCLPRDLEPLAVGFLRGEGALRRREDLREVRASPDGSEVRVRGDFDEEVLEAISRRWTVGIGCGRGGTSRDLDRPPYATVGPGIAVSPQDVLALFHDLQNRTVLWRATGGVHSCGLAEKGGIILLAEDVGRHNAFDKVTGRALLEGISLDDKLMLTTGRMSVEIVAKAVACGVPLLASRGAPTSFGVELARRFGVTLVGFVRGQRLNVYTGFQRVVT